MVNMFVTRQEFNQFRHDITNNVTTLQNSVNTIQNNVTSLQNSVNTMQNDMAMFRNEIVDIRNIINNGFQELNQRINNMNGH